MPRLQELDIRKIFCFDTQFCLRPTKRLTGLPKANVAMSSFKDALIHPRNRPKVAVVAVGLLWQLAFHPRPTLSEKPVFPLVHFDNGFQVLWHQRNLLGSSSPITENGNTELFGWEFRGFWLFLFVRGLLLAADKTSPKDMASYWHWTKYHCIVCSVLRYCVLLPKHPLTLL